tara:strand:+ start:499 stop:1335 length:837 start_codon:yes stop_codon:yes gene_type:complete
MTSTTVKIASWNVAGIRALFKKAETVALEEFISQTDFDILCLQETKYSSESQIKLPDYVKAQWPHATWSINPGISQKKGLSGTAILSKVEPISVISQPDFDTEGRITCVEFEKFIVVCVYTPNSQAIFSERFTYRTEIWDTLFRNFVAELNKRKPTIVAGDLNTVERECDYHNFKKFRNLAPGLYDEERENFALLKNIGLIDSYTLINPDKISYSYFSNFCKQRLNPGDGGSKNPKGNGWVLDYILCAESLRESIVESGRYKNQFGSDHVPIYVHLSL